MSNKKHILLNLVANSGSFEGFSVFFSTDLTNIITLTTRSLSPGRPSSSKTTAMTSTQRQKGPNYMTSTKISFNLLYKSKAACLCQMNCRLT